jgi:hypothetical protein
VRRTVPPSAEIEEQIDQLLAVGVGENPRQSLSELGAAGGAPELALQRESDLLPAAVDAPSAPRTATGIHVLLWPPAPQRLSRVCARPRPGANAVERPLGI